MCVIELFHPRAQLCLGEHWEFLQVLAAVKIVRGQMAGVKALPVEWDLIGAFHQLVYIFILFLLDFLPVIREMLFQDEQII